MSVEPMQVLHARRPSPNATESWSSDSPFESECVVGVIDQRRSLCPPCAEAKPDVSIIIPARNEERWLTATLHAALAAADEFAGSARPQNRRAEILVVDNGSTDGTWKLLTRFAAEHGIRPLRCSARGAACARNQGRHQAHGRVLIFVDADTHLPPDLVTRVVARCEAQGKSAGIVRLAALDGGWRARCWWTFWEHVRRLPLPRAKAMPAVMFCTAAVFDEFGPFDEQVAIGEEWPILAGVYQSRRHQFIYDRSLTAFSSSRRMERLWWGYTRTFAKYAWAILDRRGRINYTDLIR